MFVLLVDAHSKWIEVHITNASTTAVTIEKLKLTFASLGLLEMLVTDNGPSFASSEFTDFVKANGIQHVKTVPYHTASNGLAERAVRTFKTYADQLKHNSLDHQIPLQEDVDEQWLPPDADTNQPHQEMTEHRHSTRVRHQPVRFSPDNY